MNVRQLSTEDSLDCSHCERMGEMSLASLQRQHKGFPIKVWIRNLPKGISESGLKNLFLTVGEPLSISFNVKSNSALVEFKLMNEVELAIRDLHFKPPYNLKVTVAVPRPKTGAEGTSQQSLQDELQDTLVNVTQPGSSPMKCYSVRKAPESTKDDALDEILCEVEHQIKSIIKILGYDPSLRMRQKKLDFKTDSNCVSKGRGYMYMGDKDRFIGGLGKFQYASENSRAKDKMSFSCENCTALTTKICGSCSASFCSKECLSRSTGDCHSKCLKRSSGGKYSDGEDIADFEEDSPKRPFPEIPLESGCTVVMASYFTMLKVFVRPCDSPWEEKFRKLCNDVAVEALEGSKLEKCPDFRDLVLARYYEDLCFYRAQVCDVGENKLTVFFLDFGNTQETRLEDLKAMPPHLKNLPGLAVKVQLKGVSEISSVDAVSYFNKLTAESTPLILKFDDSTNEVVLTEKESKASVNEIVFNLALPSWKKNGSAFSKTGEILYLDSIKSQKLEVGETYNFILSHFDEKEFLESEVFWVTDQDTDEFFHGASEMLLRITEYCEFLKGDHYLPRANELCLAKENGKWHRCVNLRSQKTTCCLFFLDDGHSSFITTSDIRKMIQDFTELPSQSVCCTLPCDPKLKNNQKFQVSVVNFLKSTVGQTISSVRVLKLMGDAYCLSVPDIRSIATSILCKTP